jgi:putative restriction endonuclease
MPRSGIGACFDTPDRLCSTTTSCNADHVALRFFGEIPGSPVDTWWPSREEVARAGVHRPLQAGISGSATEGADSICVSGGYEDDEDYKNEIIYTGAGGNDPATKQQIADQSIDQPGNAGLVPRPETLAV